MKKLIIGTVLLTILILMVSCSSAKEDVPQTDGRPILSPITVVTALSNWMYANPDHPVAENIHGIGQRRNGVTIQMAEYNEEQVALFREEFEIFLQHAWHFIEFEQSDGILEIVPWGRMPD